MHIKAIIRSEAGESSGGGGNVTAEGAPAVEVKMIPAPDVERIVKDRTHKANAELAATKSQLEEARKAAARVEELEHQLATMGKSDAEKQLAEMQREAQKHRQAFEQSARERDEAVSRAANAEKQRDAFIVETQLSNALAKGGCLPNAIKTATDALVRTGQVEVIRGDDGSTKIVAHVDGLIFDDVGQAAAAFLKSNPFFQAHAPGGAGSAKPNGANAMNGLREAPAQDRIKAGLRSV